MLHLYYWCIINVSTISSILAIFFIQNTYYYQVGCINSHSLHLLFLQLKVSNISLAVWIICVNYSVICYFYIISCCVVAPLDTSKRYTMYIISHYYCYLKKTNAQTLNYKLASARSRQIWLIAEGLGAGSARSCSFCVSQHPLKGQGVVTGSLAKYGVVLHQIRHPSTECVYFSLPVTTTIVIFYLLIFFFFFYQCILSLSPCYLPNLYSSQRPMSRFSLVSYFLI